MILFRKRSKRNKIIMIKKTKLTNRCKKTKKIRNTSKRIKKTKNKFKKTKNKSQRFHMR